jgi:hypothetical protein
MPGLPAVLRLAGAIAVPVERFAEEVEDPAERDADTTPTTRRRDAKLPSAEEKPRERKARRPRGG